MKIKKHFKDLHDKYGYIPYNKISADILEEIKDYYKTIEDAVKDLIPDKLEETKDKNEIRQYFEDFIDEIGYIPDTDFKKEHKIKRSISYKISKYYSTPENKKNRVVLKSCIYDLMDNPDELIEIRNKKFKSLRKKAIKV